MRNAKIDIPTDAQPGRTPDRQTDRQSDRRRSLSLFCALTQQGETILPPSPPPISSHVRCAIHSITAYACIQPASPKVCPSMPLCPYKRYSQLHMHIRTYVPIYSLASWISQEERQEDARDEEEKDFPLLPTGYGQLMLAGQIVLIFTHIDREYGWRRVSDLDSCA